LKGYDLTEDLASALELPVTQGVLVTRVYRGSSAEKAGIRGASEIARLYNEIIRIGGDIITNVDERPIASLDELKLALEAKRPGDTVNVTFFRGKTRQQKPVILAEAPRQQGLRF